MRNCDSMANRLPELEYAWPERTPVSSHKADSVRGWNTSVHEHLPWLWAEVIEKSILWLWD